MLKTTWKTEYQGHVIELENRPSLERLIVDGKEIAREPGATWEPRSFQATIPDGNRSMKVEPTLVFQKVRGDSDSPYRWMARRFIAR